MYLCGMMTLTLNEAWAHFWNGIRKSPERWSALTQAEKMELYQANAAAAGQRKSDLGIKRMLRLMEKHEPDRYSISITFK